MEGMLWNYNGGRAMNVVMNNLLIMMMMKWVISLNVIYERLLRLLNKSEGRDVIELELRSWDDGKDE